MRFFKVTLVMLLLVAFSPRLTADEADDFMKFYSWWDGTWAVEATEEGADESRQLEWKITQHEGNCHLVEGGGTSVWGYDPKRKKWVGTGFGADGSFFTTILDRHQGSEVTPGTKVNSTSRIKKADGTVSPAELIWHYIDENTATITRTEKSETGETLRTITFHCKRKK